MSMEVSGQNATIYKEEDEKEYPLNRVGVFGTFLLFNSHESTEVTIAITAHIGALIAGQLRQL